MQFVGKNNLWEIADHRSYSDSSLGVFMQTCMSAPHGHMWNRVGVDNTHEVWEWNTDERQPVSRQWALKCRVQTAPSLFINASDVHPTSIMPSCITSFEVWINMVAFEGFSHTHQAKLLKMVEENHVLDVPHVQRCMVKENQVTSPKSLACRLLKDGSFSKLLKLVSAIRWNVSVNRLN